MRIPSISKTETCAVCGQIFHTARLFGKKICSACNSHAASIQQPKHDSSPKSSSFSKCVCGQVVPPGYHYCPRCAMRIQHPGYPTIEISGTDHNEVMKVANNYYERFFDRSSDGSASPNQSKFSEQVLCGNIQKALLHIQKNPIFYTRMENELNDAVRDNLGMLYTVLDQTRQGTSESGKRAGSVDLLICKDDGLPYAIVEAMRLSSVDKAYILSHVEKVLTRYDPVGCPYAFILTYAVCDNFESFCSRFNQFIQTIVYPIGSLKTIQNHPVLFSESHHIQAALSRNGKELNVHFMTIHIPK